MRILAVRQTVRGPMKIGDRQRAALPGTQAGFLLLSFALLIGGPAGAASVAADEGMCAAISGPSASDKPNAPETVCDCARDYLSHVGREIAAIQTQAEQLIGKPRADRTGPIGSPVFTRDDIDQDYFGKGMWGQFDTFTPPGSGGPAPPAMYQWSGLLQRYKEGHSSLACEISVSDRSKVAELEKEKQTLEQNQEKAKASNDAASAERQAAFAKQQQAMHDLTEAMRATHDPTERTRLVQQFREQQSSLAKEMAQNARSMTPNVGESFRISRIKGQLDAYAREFAQTKPSTYQEMQYAARHRWRLQLTLAQDQLLVIQSDENKAEADLNRKWNESTDQLGKKWVAVWEQQLAAQKTSHKVKDETGWANETLGLCRSNDSLLESDFNDRVRAMQAIARPLKDARDTITHEMQLWQRFATRDGWPAGGTKDTGFGEFTHKLFEPPTLLFLTVQDTKLQGRQGAPRTSEEANCLMCDLSAESPTIAAFWNQHLDCQRWNGRVPEGVRLVKSRDKDAPVVEPSRLSPFRSFNPSYLALNPFENLTFVDQKIVPGAADHDQP